MVLSEANSTTWAPNSETKVGQAFTTSGASFERQRNKVWLWHKCLGKETQHQSDQSPPFIHAHEDSLPLNNRSSSQNNRSPLSNFSHPASVSQNDRLIRKRNQSPPCFQNLEETVYRFSEILPASDPSSALKLYQSPAEDVIQVTSPPETDNTYET
ncbi:unnamed protein product [Prunus brigantina]